MHDTLQAFLLDDGAYRGLLLHLDDSYQEILNLHAYPAPVAKLLGDALCAVTLLSNNLKQEGKLALQIETPGFVKMLVAEANHKHGIRGLLQWRDECPRTDALLESGRFAITMMPKDAPYYQGIVPIIKQDIAQSLETYFTQSEQIFTRIMLAGTDKKMAGLFIQKLPSEKAHTLDSTTLNFLLKTLQPQELLENETEKLLHHLFHEYTVRLFAPEKIHFECTCNDKKMLDVVKMLGKEDALALISTHKEVEVICEFCNDYYRFDKAAVEQIFA